MSVVGDFSGTPLVVAGQIWRRRRGGDRVHVIYNLVAEEGDAIVAEFVTIGPGGHERGEVTCDELRRRYELVYDATLIRPTAVEVSR